MNPPLANLEVEFKFRSLERRVHFLFEPPHLAEEIIECV
jgi:hypothetical protein